MFVQSMPSKMMRPDVSLSRPAIHRKTVLFPAPEGPNRIVVNVASLKRIDASTRAPPLNCLSMSAISSKEPHFPIQRINNRENYERNNQQHGGGDCGRRVVESLDLVINVDR